MARFSETPLTRPGSPQLHTCIYEGDEPRRSVLFLHGYDDHCGRSSLALDHLADNGYRVRAFDFRGHGRSGGPAGFCRSWADYLDDLDYVLKEEENAGEGRPFLLAQSHGCLVAGHWVLRHPDSVAGMVLCAPYLRLIMPVPRMKLAVAGLLNRVAPSLRLKSEVHTSMLTSDPERHAEDAADRLLRRVATPRWFIGSGVAQTELMARAEEIRLPVLLIHGGADPIADPAAAREFFDRLGSTDKTYADFPEMRHEPLRERGRERVWGAVREWLDARS